MPGLGIRAGYLSQHLCSEIEIGYRVGNLQGLGVLTSFGIFASDLRQIFVDLG